MASRTADILESQENKDSTSDTLDILEGDQDGDEVNLCFDEFTRKKNLF